MFGALFAHATRLGFGGSATAEMWPLALVVLVAASVVLVAASVVLFGRRGELPLVGRQF